MTERSIKWLASVAGLVVLVGTPIITGVSSMALAKREISDKPSRAEVSERFLRDSLRHDAAESRIADQMRQMNETLREVNARLREICQGVRQGCR